MQDTARSCTGQMYQAAVADRPQAAVPALALSNQALAAAQTAANATRRPRG